MNFQGWHLDPSAWPEQVPAVGLVPSRLEAGHSWYQEITVVEKQGPAAAGEKNPCQGRLDEEGQTSQGTARVNVSCLLCSLLAG